jgi:hypothetical protein
VRASVDAQSRERCVRVAYEVGEIPVIVYAESNGRSGVCNPMHISAGRVIPTAWTVEIRKGVHYIGITRIREESQQSNNCKSDLRHSRSVPHGVD